MVLILVRVTVRFMLIYVTFMVRARVRVDPVLAFVWRDFLPR